MIQPSYFRTISAASTPKSRCSTGRKPISPRCPPRGAHSAAGLLAIYAPSANAPTKSEARRPSYRPQPYTAQLRNSFPDGPPGATSNRHVGATPS